MCNIDTDWQKPEWLFYKRGGAKCVTHGTHSHSAEDGKEEHGYVISDTSRDFWKETPVPVK